MKNALLSLPEVESAEVSHKDGTAAVTLKKPADYDKLKAVVEAEGYKVIGEKK